MTLFYNDGFGPDSTRQIELRLVDSSGDHAVYQLQVDGGEQVFFEATPDTDVINLVELGLQARRMLKEEL